MLDWWIICSYLIFALFFVDNKMEHFLNSKMGSLKFEVWTKRRFTAFLGILDSLLKIRKHHWTLHFSNPELMLLYNLIRSLLISPTCLMSWFCLCISGTSDISQWCTFFKVLSQTTFPMFLTSSIASINRTENWFVLNLKMGPLGSKGKSRIFVTMIVVVVNQEF